MSCRSIDFDNKEGFKKDVMHWLLIQLHNRNSLPLVWRCASIREGDVRGEFCYIYVIYEGDDE